MDGLEHHPHDLIQVCPAYVVILAAVLPLLLNHEAHPHQLVDGRTDRGHGVSREIADLILCHGIDGQQYGTEDPAMERPEPSRLEQSLESAQYSLSLLDDVGVSLGHQA